MKVLFTTHYAGFFGANRSMLNLANDLKKRYNVEPYIICQGEGELNEQAKKLNIPVQSVKYYSWCVGNAKNKMLKNKIKVLINKIKMLINDLFLLPRINEIINVKEYDLIHCNTSASNLGAKLAVKNKKKFVWHIREFGKADYNLAYIDPKRKVERLYQKANKIITVSKALEQSFVSEFNVGNTQTLYNGITLSNIDKRDSSIRQFCCVGLLCEPKGQLEILQASKKLLEKGETNFMVNFYGAGSTEYTEKLERFVAENTLENNVKFWGYQEDMSSFWPEMQVGIMSSKNEAFGRVTVEYMMAKMPVIGTKTGGTVEIIEEGKTGCLYSTNDIEALANHMQRYILDESLLKRHGDNGCEQAQARFSQESNTDAVYAIYKAILV